MTFHKSCFDQKIIGVKTIDQAEAYNKKHEDKDHIPDIKIRKLREKIFELNKEIDKLEAKQIESLRHGGSTASSSNYYIPRVTSSEYPQDVADTINAIEKIGKESSTGDWVFFIRGKWYKMTIYHRDPSDDRSYWISMTDIKTGITKEINRPL